MVDDIWCIGSPNCVAARGAQVTSTNTSATENDRTTNNDSTADSDCTTNNGGTDSARHSKAE
jgi:hypothetical protein